MELKKNYKFWFATGYRIYMEMNAWPMWQNMQRRLWRHSMPPEIFHMKLYGNRP